MNHKIYSNGKEISDQQTIHLLQDESVGVFETMRVYGGRIFKLEEHLQRLSESAKTVGFKPLPDLEKLRNATESALIAFKGDSLSKVVKGTVPLKNISVRLTLCDEKVFVIIGSREIVRKLYQTGVALKTASFPRGNGNTFPYQVKASAYQQAVLASTEPNPANAYEWVFLDEGNCLTETRTGNFFLVKKEGEKATLLTPPEHLILNGVTRRFVIKCALELGCSVKEMPLTRHDFFNAEEAFLSNTSWEILPVRELDGRAIGAKVPGPMTTKLHRLFIRRIKENVSRTHS